jgi:hypothetical protein
MVVNEVSSPVKPWRMRGMALFRIFASPRGGLSQPLLDAAARHWGRLAPEDRRRLSECFHSPGLTRQLHRAIAAAAGGTAPARRSAALLIADSGAAEQTGLLCGLLEDRVREVADAAEEALVAVARLAGSLAPESEAAIELHRAVAEGARAFPIHRRRGVFLAAAILLDAARAQPESSPLVRWLADSEHESHIGFRALIRRSTDPLVRARAWRWLGGGGRARTMAAASLDRVAVAHGREDHEAVLPAAYLLANPERARRAALLNTRPRIRQRPGAPGDAIPTREDLSTLSVHARRGLPRFIAAIRMDDNARSAALEPLLIDPDPVARHAAARVLSGPALFDYCFDRDERVAHSSALRAAEAPGSAAVLPRLIRSPHPRLRVFAAEEARSADTWDPTHPASRLAARRVIARDREGFLAGLRSRITSGAPAGRVAAIILARRLNAVSHVELELLASLQLRTDVPADDPVAATAVAALADLASDSAAAAIRACLSHPVARVRANAIEAIHRRPPADQHAAHSVFGMLIEFKSDPHHRVRANAIRGLLSTAPAGPVHEPSAVDGLTAMLADDRPQHRLAGLWLAERVMTNGAVVRRWNDLASRVADLARGEPDGLVRARATHCARRVLAQVRATWAGRAAQVRDGSEDVP